MCKWAFSLWSRQLLYALNLLCLENTLTFCMTNRHKHTGAVLLAVSAGHICAWGLFYSRYIFKGDSKIQIALLPKRDILSCRPVTSPCSKLCRREQKKTKKQQHKQHWQICSFRIVLHAQRFVQMCGCNTSPNNTIKGIAESHCRKQLVVSVCVWERES